MHRHTTTLGTLIVLILVSTPALAQESSGPDGPSGPVGAAPGSDDDRADEESSDEDSASSETSASSDDTSAGNEESDKKEEGADRMEGTRDDWDSETDTDEQAQSTDHPSTENLLVLGAHAGAALPAFDDLGPWGTFGLEVGILPRLEEMKDKPLEVGIVARYSQPGATGNGSDANLGPTGGSYSWEITHQTLTFDGILLWRFRNLSEILAPYVLGGARLNLTQTTLSGAADEDSDAFGTLRETNTHVGFVAGAGTDFHLGPGTLFGEITFGWTKLDQNLTELGTTSAFALDVGYRFFPF